MSYFGVGAVKRSFPPLRYPVGSRVQVTSGPPVTNVPKTCHGIVRHTEQQQQPQRWYMGTVVQQWSRDYSFTGYFAPYLVELDPVVNTYTSHNEHATGVNPMILISFDSDLWIRCAQKLEVQNLKRKRGMPWNFRRLRPKRDEPGTFSWSTLFGCVRPSAKDPMTAVHPNAFNKIKYTTPTPTTAMASPVWMDTVWKARRACVVVAAFSDFQSILHDDGDNNGYSVIERIRAANMVAILLHAGGLPVVLAAMKRHVDNAVVQATACSFLTAIGRRNHGNMEAVFAADGVSHILLAMHSHLDSTPVQRSASQALSQLAWLEGGERAILQAHGVPILIASIRKNLRHVEILKDACGVLLYLSLRRENRSFIIQHGGRVAAVVALGEHPNDPNLEKLVRSLLKNLNSVEEQQQLRGPIPTPPTTPTQQQLRGPIPTPLLIPPPPQLPPLFKKKRYNSIGPGSPSSSTGSPSSKWNSIGPGSPSSSIGSPRRKCSSIGPGIPSSSIGPSNSTGSPRRKCNSVGPGSPSHSTGSPRRTFLV